MQQPTFAPNDERGSPLLGPGKLYHERLVLISVVYGAVVKQTETLHGKVGGDLAYLLGAIAWTFNPPGKCQFSSKSRIVQILRDSFAPDHRIWSFIELT